MDRRGFQERRRNRPDQVEVEAIDADIPGLDGGEAADLAFGIEPDALPSDRGAERVAGCSKRILARALADDGGAVGLGRGGQRILRERRQAWIG